MKETIRHDDDRSTDHQKNMLNWDTICDKWGIKSTIDPMDDPNYLFKNTSLTKEETASEVLARRERKKPAFNKTYGSVPDVFPARKNKPSTNITMKYLTTELGYDVYLEHGHGIHEFNIIAINQETKKIIKSLPLPYNKTVQLITNDGVIFRYEQIPSVLRVYEQSMIVDCAEPKNFSSPEPEIPEFEDFDD